MSHEWSSETKFRQVDLYVRDQTCSYCNGRLHVCSHRKRRVFTLQGPCELTVRLGHCPNEKCEGHHHTVSPIAELSIALPRLAIGWDIFAWVGHSRFARHWSVAQICAELGETRGIDLSENAIEDNISQYSTMITAQHMDLEQMRKDYEDSESVVLSIDGLQPKKGTRDSLCRSRTDPEASVVCVCSAVEHHR